MNQKLEDNYSKRGAYKTLKINLIFSSVNTIYLKEIMTPSNYDTIASTNERKLRIVFANYFIML